ncbi:NEW3 domain-containing protein [Methanococcoides sp. AM1]|uniref:COG1470 family protein n=1 Tax=Methanococcoides sp. AM1 TaxID=1201011 RepID=UPI0010828B29|nr:NEW3 domain-containing protein [Methanococcoides sp. AM1]
MNRKMMVLSFIMAIFVLAVPSLAVTNSVEVSDLDDIDYEGWLKEEIELSANEEIKLGNYSLNYIYPQNGGPFVEDLTIQEKRTDTAGNERFYQIADFSGHEDIYDLKGKVIFIERSSLAFRIDEIDDDGLKLTVWSNEDIFLDVEIFTDVPEFVQFYKDESVSIPLEINNSGSIDETFDLGVNGPGFYSYEFVSNGYKVSRINVDSGDVENLELKLHIDKNCPAGDYNLSISGSGRTSDILYLPFSVTEDLNTTSDPELTMQLSSLYVSGEAGSEVTVPVRVLNSGNVDLEDIDLDTDSPGNNWDLEFSENDIDRINSEEYVNVDLNIRIPSEAENGDYFVDISAESGDVEADETKLRVNVKSSSNSAWIGLLIIILLVVGLVFAAKKYGRR